MSNKLKYVISGLLVFVVVNSLSSGIFPSNNDEKIFVEPLDSILQNSDFYFGAYRTCYYDLAAGLDRIDIIKTSTGSTSYPNDLAAG